MAGGLVDGTSVSRCQTPCGLKDIVYDEIYMIYIYIVYIVYVYIYIY